jgi:photosynthetic reaction center M subunit
MTVEYQNIFTGCRCAGPTTPASHRRKETENRIGKPVFNYWAGKIGDAQIGPIYLGWSGTLSLLFGFIAFEIIGLNMWASVNWSPSSSCASCPGWRWSRRLRSTG